MAAAPGLGPGVLWTCGFDSLHPYMVNTWDDPEHDVMEDLQEAKRNGLEQDQVTFKPVVNRRDAEILILNGWIEGQDFEIYSD